MDPLPPETSTPMPPVLRYEYNKHLGWPGRSEDDPHDPPIVVKPHVTPKPTSSWARFIQKMSDRTPTVTP